MSEIPEALRLYTVAEAAEIVRMSPKWVLAKIRAGELPAKLIHLGGNGEYRITASALAAFIESLPDAPPRLAPHPD